MSQPISRSISKVSSDSTPSTPTSIPKAWARRTAASIMCRAPSSERRFRTKDWSTLITVAGKRERYCREEYPVPKIVYGYDHPYVGKALQQFDCLLRILHDGAFGYFQLEAFSVKAPSGEGFENHLAEPG